MFKKLWEWRVDEQVVSAKLNLLTGRETIAVDGVPAFDKISVKPRNVIPLQFGSGRQGRVVVSLGWNLGPRCVLEVDGKTLEPDVRPVRSKAQLVVQSVLLALFAGFVGMAVAPWIWGGSELPPPRWSVGDLAPIPDETDNAWHVMMSVDPFPEREQWPLDKRERIAPGDVSAAKEDLAQPEAVALLAGVPEVLSRPQLAIPDDKPLEPSPVYLVEWRHWLAIDLAVRMKSEPLQVAQTVATTLPLWIGCANAARSLLNYAICARQAERDLIVMRNLVEELPHSASEPRVVSEAALREAPPMTADNAMRASYLESYQLLASLVARHNIWVDKRATSETFERLMSQRADEAFCESREKFSFPRAIYTYNYLGDQFARVAAQFACVGVEYADAETETVANARRELLAMLTEPQGLSE